MANLNEYMILDESAAYSGLAKITPRQRARKGKLVSVRIGKRGNGT